MSTQLLLLEVLTVLTVSSQSVATTNPPPVCLSNSEDVAECSPCGLYLAESTVNEGRLAFFTGVDRPAGSPVGSEELLLSIVDANKNEYSPWHDSVWEASVLLDDALLKNNFTHDLLISGIGALASCRGSHSNVALSLHHQTTPTTRADDGVHRSTHPTAGSFSNHPTVQAVSTADLMQAGDEIFVDCGAPTAVVQPPRKRHGDYNRSPEWLQTHGTCVDTLTVAPSTLPGGVGKGAFVQRPVAAGSVIVPSPMLYFDRSQLEIVQQQAYNTTTTMDRMIMPFARPHGIEYDAETVVGHQLLQNYCYGRADSNVMLFPLAPGVNFINHQDDADKVNAYIRWSTKLGNNDEIKAMPVMELLEVAEGDEGALVLEFVALRDLQPGDEVFIDYGKDWVEAWEKHVREWKGWNDSSWVSAAKYVAVQHERGMSATDLIRTEKEQETKPYPENLRTACYFVYEKSEEESTGNVVPWHSGENLECLRPCDVKLREGDPEKVPSFTAVVHSIENIFEPEECGRMPKGGVTVSGIPPDAIAIVDKPYSTDEFMHGAFRHEIGVPNRLYPQNWLAADPNPYGDFIASPLPPAMMAPIRWQGSAEVVTPWAFRIGLPKSIRTVLLDYCNKMGITDIFRHVTIKGNSLSPGENGFLQIDGESWYLQRPESEWRSNLHWLSPGDNPAHEDYLQALSVAGFDEVLDGAGKYLGMNGLVAFHVTFIAVSQSTRGYLHHDVLWTGAKTYNVIIPLLLANETGPELDLQGGVSYQEYDEKTNYTVGRYRYEYEVGSMMGDGAVHATSAVDYRRGKEMRMAATVYIADVNEQNYAGILAEYTQSYPPRDKSVLLGWAGRHWRRDDPSVKLPKHRDNHILVRTVENIETS